MNLPIRFIGQILDADQDPNAPGGRINIPIVGADVGTIQSILATVFLIAGGLSVIFIVIGGLQYVLSSGEPNGTKRAKDTIMYAVIGLVLALLAFVIVVVVTNTVQ